MNASSATFLRVRNQCGREPANQLIAEQPDNERALQALEDFTDASKANMEDLMQLVENFTEDMDRNRN